MSANGTIKLNDFEQETDVKLLPAHINHSGEANVEKYFIESKDSEGVVSAHLRGRLLKGREISIPTGFKGIVIDARKRSHIGSFRKFVLYQHDHPPDSHNPVVSGVDWIKAHGVIHDV